MTIFMPKGNQNDFNSLLNPANYTYSDSFVRC